MQMQMWIWTTCALNCTLNALSYLCMGTFAGRDLALLSDSLWGDTDRERWCVDLCCSGTSSVVLSLSLSLSLSLPRSLSFSLGRLSAAVSTRKHVKHAILKKKKNFPFQRISQIFKYISIQFQIFMQKYSRYLLHSFPACAFVHETLCSRNANAFFLFCIYMQLFCSDRHTLANYTDSLLSYEKEQGFYFTFGLSS